MNIKAFFKRIYDRYFHETKWKCGLCGKELFDGNYLCESCLKKLPFNDKNICNHCGRQTIYPEDYCLTCKNILVSIDVGRSVFLYEGKIRKLIVNFKHRNQRYLSELFGKFLYDKYCECKFNPDFITFVPMSDKRLKKRGFNQTELLAKNLSERSGKDVLPIFSKVSETKRQAKLSYAERIKNLRGSFKVTDKKAVRGKSVLIVDDVTTTGATGEILAALLKKAGAKTVTVLTIASVKKKEGY